MTIFVGQLRGNTALIFYFFFIKKDIRRHGLRHRRDFRNFLSSFLMECFCNLLYFQTRVKICNYLSVVTYLYNTGEGVPPSRGPVSGTYCMSRQVNECIHHTQITYTSCIDHVYIIHFTY